MKRAFILLSIILATAFITGSLTAFSQERGKENEILLWPAGIPDGPGPQGDEQISNSGSYTNILHPRLLVHRPEQPNGLAILVISGGGYAHIEGGNESKPVAEWLSTQGITAFELIYRLPGEGWANTDVPFQDGQRAMRIIRSRASAFGVDLNKIGVMGFSAGGHLAGILGTRFDKAFYVPRDQIDQLSARPDFAALLYPVITMLPPFDHTHSEKSIIGKHPALSQEKSYSVQLHVSKHTPPVFLAQAADDPISNVENSKLMYRALRQNKIASEIHLFRTGGHGWGLGKPGTEEAAWPELFKTWMKQINMWR